MQCLLESPCIKRDHKTANQCLQPEEDVPEACRTLQHLFFECKRGQVRQCALMRWQQCSPFRSVHQSRAQAVVIDLVLLYSDQSNIGPSPPPHPHFPVCTV